MAETKDLKLLRLHLEAAGTLAERIEDHLLTVRIVEIVTIMEKAYPAA